MPDGLLWGQPSPRRPALHEAGMQSRTGFAIPGSQHKGRGAASNPGNRFEETAVEALDDGWGTLAEDLADLPPLATQLLREKSKSALTYNDSPDIGFDRSINPYRGCEHGCIYCFARPSHAYLGYSPGLDFETKLLFKPDLPALLERELSRPGYVPRPVALGANTDPYQPVERNVALTRQVLEILERYNHPVTVVTKSALVLRDADILARMAAKNLAQVAISVTTLDGALARTMEPRAASPTRRLAAMAEFVAAGHSDSRAGGADDPWAERCRTGEDPARRRQCRGVARGLRAAAPAVGDPGPVRGVDRQALPEPGAKSVVAGAADPGWGDVSKRVRNPAERHRSLCELLQQRFLRAVAALAWSGGWAAWAGWTANSSRCLTRRGRRPDRWPCSEWCPGLSPGQADLAQG